jgi:hypothetical protein
MSQMPYHPGPAQPTPEQRLLLMNDTEWEEFIEQCALQLQREGKYTQVIHLGGAGDKGRDVCGYTTRLPTEGTWDLYQGKHYGSSLAPSTFAPELAKFLWCVFSKTYTRPSNYFICAIKVGPALHDYVLNPDKFKAWILEEWKEKKGNFGTFRKALTPELNAFIKVFPFDVITVKTNAALLEIHSRSSKHWDMFGVLPAREPNPEMPEEPEAEEHQYIKALLDVYQEATGVQVTTPSYVPSKYGKHFKSQRMLFYSAEGLYRFSRDKLPGTFEELVNQVAVGIGSDLNYPHPDGLARLTKVLETARQLQVQSNPLYARLKAGDLSGTCHHLANQRRAFWVDDDE